MIKITWHDAKDWFHYGIDEMIGDFYYDEIENYISSIQS